MDDNEEELILDSVDDDLEDQPPFGRRIFINPFRPIVSTPPIQGDDLDGEETDDYQTFDVALPAKHTYLGNNLQEARGYTLMDLDGSGDDSRYAGTSGESSSRNFPRRSEGQICQIPLLPPYSGVSMTLVPGQILPMTVFHPQAVSMLKLAIERDRTFGVLAVKGLDLNDEEVDLSYVERRITSRTFITEADYETYPLFEIGTTAEIFEFQADDTHDDPEQNRSSGGFSLKAKGSQRFKVLEIHRQIDGNLTAKVKILPEVVLPFPLWEGRLKSLDRHRSPIYKHWRSRFSGIFYRKPEKNTDRISLAANICSLITKKRKGDSPEDWERICKINKMFVKEESKFREVKYDEVRKAREEDLIDLLGENHEIRDKTIYEMCRDRYYVNWRRPKRFSLFRNRRWFARQDALVTPWPHLVYRLYDTEVLVNRVHRDLKNLFFCRKKERVLFLKGTVGMKPDDYALDTSLPLPKDPVELSYWLVQNLPINDRHRLMFLSMNSAVQRLQRGINVLEKCQKLVCSTCSNHIGDQRNAFCMSVAGPQGTYVNPGGYVHETLTLSRATGLKVLSRSPSTEHSWFPGYAWSVAECDVCGHHMGWLFTVAPGANPDLRPRHFWGLCRNSLVLGQSTMSDEDNIT